MLCLDLKVREVLNKHPVALEEMNEQVSRIAKVSVPDCENQTTLALRECREQLKFTNVIHVIFFINGMLHIVSIIVLVYVGGEKQLALLSIMPTGSNTAATGDVIIAVSLQRVLEVPTTYFESTVLVFCYVFDVTNYLLAVIKNEKVK